MADRVRDFYLRFVPRTIVRRTLSLSQHEYILDWTVNDYQRLSEKSVEFVGSHV